MSVLFGAPAQRRAWGVEPPIPPNSQQGSTYARVDLSRTESSLQKVAVWACVALVRSITEVLPIHAFSGAGPTRQEVPLPPWMNNLDGLGYGLPDWCGQLVYSEMLRGNGVGLVEDRDPVQGTPTQILLQHPDVVSAWREPGSGKPQWHVEGKSIDAGRIWHHRVNSVPGQLMGLSPVRMHALTIGTGIAAMRFGAQWFEDGAHPSSLLTSDKGIDQGQARTAKERFLAALRGTREPVVLGGGWKYQAIQIAPNESQFLETNGYTSAECCRIFGPALAEVFGYETGGSLTYANIEQRSLDLLTYAADPWLVRVERVLTSLLRPGLYVKFNRKALVRTDLLTRYQAYQIALRNQFEVVNEVRDHEDMAPVTWGNDPLPVGPAPTPVSIEGVVANG